MSNLPVLSLLETRVVGVLVEKQHTVPDTYPLTLNSLVSGCNQKTSRDPVIEATEAEVQAVVDRLRTLSLVVESSGGRVMRYAHNAGKVLNVPGQSVAILAVLFLRGPQTPGELRINSDRLYKFGDISAVEGFLDELAERGFVRQLARQPGSREARWAHLLSGESAIPAAASPSEFPQASRDGDALTAGEIAAIKANVDHLQAEVESLKETVARLCKELGVPPLS
jgi:uncharacterized protein YceH (UPF0502 family)